MTPDGRRLAYAEHGDPSGQPVLMFHGSPGSRVQSHPDVSIARELGLRVLTVDRPGYGLSDRHPGRALLDWPADVEALADALGLGRFPIIGVSGGGPHAAACAFRLPHRVTRLALASSAGPFDVPELISWVKLADRMMFPLARRAPGLLGWLLSALLRSLP